MPSLFQQTKCHVRVLPLFFPNIPYFCRLCISDCVFSFKPRNIRSGYLSNKYENFVKKNIALWALQQDGNFPQYTNLSFLSIWVFMFKIAHEITNINEKYKSHYFTPLRMQPKSTWCCNTQYDWTHYSDVIVGAMASQITSLTIVSSGAYQRKHQSSASLAFVRGIHRWPVNSPHKGPVTRKMFPFNDVIMENP